MFQRRMAARRRMSPIEQLQKQYQAGIEAVGKERDTAYSSYRAEVDPVVKEYEKNLAEYGKSSAAYTAESAKYAKGLAAYQKELADYPAFVDKTVKYATETGGGYFGRLFGTGPQISYVAGTRQLLSDFLKQEKGSLLTEKLSRKGGVATYRIPNPDPKPKFEMAKPIAPTAPSKPDIAKFDPEPYTRKSKQVEETYKREVGERKAGRLAAVSRRRARPLLGG